MLCAAVLYTVQVVIARAVGILRYTFMRGSFETRESMSSAFRRILYILAAAAYRLCDDVDGIENQVGIGAALERFQVCRV